MQHSAVQNIDEIQKEIIKGFTKLEGNREDMLNYIMDLGEKMPPLDPSHKIEPNTVQGCMSKVWLVCTREGDRLFFKADSNTAITKGLVGLLLHVLSGQTIDTILHANLYFVSEIGMTQLIGSQRSSGFASIVKHLKLLALTQQKSH